MWCLYSSAEATLRWCQSVSKYIPIGLCIRNMHPGHVCTTISGHVIHRVYVSTVAACPVQAFSQPHPETRSRSAGAPPIVFLRCTDTSILVYVYTCTLYILYISTALHSVLCPLYSLSLNMVSSAVLSRILCSPATWTGSVKSRLSGGWIPGIPSHTVSYLGNSLRRIRTL